MNKSVRLVLAFVALLFLSELTFAQDFDWAAQFSGLEGVATNGVAVDVNGYVYTAGSFEGTADFDPGPGTFNLTSAGREDAFISVLDSAGNFVRAGQLGGAGPGPSTAVAVDASGNVYTAGFFIGTVDFDPGPGTFNLTTATDYYDAFVSVLDSAGNFVWAAQLAGPNEPGQVLAYGLAVDRSGNVYTVGWFEGTADFDPGPGTFELTSAGARDVFVSVLDRAGDFVWAGRLGGPGYDYGFGVAVGTEGDVYIVGRFRDTADFDPGLGTFNLTTAGSGDAFVSVLDSAGNFVWAGQLGGPGGDVAGDVVVDALDNVYTVGSFAGTADFDPGPDTFNLTSSGPYDGFISVLDNAGKFVWAVQLGGPDSDAVNDVAVDALGNVYTVGSFAGTADFDPGPDTFNLTSSGPYDGFISVLDSAGNFVWAGQSGGPGGAGGNGVVVDASGRLHIVGVFSGTVDFDPGPGTFNLTTATDYDDTFVSVLGLCGYFDEPSTYGILLFAPQCTLDASSLPQNVYNSATIGMRKGANDAFYLSSHGVRFDPLAVDDLVYCNGLDSALGPYDYQPGVPPFVYNAPIDHNLVPQPAHDITNLVPANPSQVQFELLDSDRVVYGHTAVYLVRDCGIWVGEDDAGPTLLNWVSHDVDVGDLQSNLDVATGMLSELRGDGDFSRACDIGSFPDTTQVADGRADPPPQDGYYYLVNGTCAHPIGYGNSSAGPRQGLPPATTCP